MTTLIAIRVVICSRLENYNIAKCAIGEQNQCLQDVKTA